MRRREMAGRGEGEGRGRIKSFLHIIFPPRMELLPEVTDSSRTEKREKWSIQRHNISSKAPPEERTNAFLLFDPRFVKN